MDCPTEEERPKWRESLGRAGYSVAGNSLSSRGVVPHMRRLELRQGKLPRRQEHDHRQRLLTENWALNPAARDGRLAPSEAGKVRAMPPSLQLKTVGVWLQLVQRCTCC